MTGRQLSIAVVGADFPNRRGPSRRFEIALCRPGEMVSLTPEPRNPADPSAIAVFSARGIQIGYVRAERAPLLQLAMKRGIVQAIFQRRDRWGCTIRVGLNGTSPELPTSEADSRSQDWPPPGSEDADWWPDEEWPDE